MAIYKSFRVRALEPWYQLPKEEQDNLLRKFEEARAQAGGKLIVYCQSGWANEKWHFFGIDEYPDIEAVQRHRDLLDEFDSSRYVESETLLGTEVN